MDRVQIPVLAGPGRGHWLRWEGVRRGAAAMAGRYESDVAAFLTRTLPDKRCFWDVGAATGYFTRFALRTLPVGATVVAVEPDPTLRPRLEALPSGNRTVFIRGVALGRADGGGLLASHPGDYGRLVAAGNAVGRPVTVRSLDSMVRSGDVPPPDVAKIDVEGAEVDVLAGMADALAALPDLAIECHSMGALAENINTLQGIGYSRIWCSSGGDLIGPPMLFASAT